MEKDSI